MYFIIALFYIYFSAGVGRSGTFIALDRLLQEIIDHDVIDIFNVVAEMRRERVWMVQTEVRSICFSLIGKEVLVGRLFACFSILTSIL